MEGLSNAHVTLHKHNWRFYVPLHK
jgi:hypothetical protein